MIKTTAWLTALSILIFFAETMEANEKIGFIENFALASDRETVLKQLIPGSEDYYYLHALHYQNEQQWDKLASIMEPWIKRYGETVQVEEIRNREALLRYPEDNKKTLDYLKRKLGLHFNHQQQKLNAKPNLPTSLNQKLISWETYLAQAFRTSQTIRQVEDSGLDKILRDNVDLNSSQRRDLLQRLEYPDYERLVGLIAADLRSRESRGFGEFKIHNQLLPEQLNELQKLRPEIANDTNFIYAKIRKLCPGEDVNWRRDSVEREAWLGRMWKYVNTLDPAFNSLKGHVLFQLLQHHRAKGEYPEDLWMSYIKLPRRTNYIDPRFLNSPNGRRNQVDLNADFNDVTRCQSIGNDEPLVREYLLHTFIQAPSYEAYQPYIRDDYLKKLFAEAKLTSGADGSERWYSLLNPSELNPLRDRVDIKFAPSNREQYLPDDDVVLQLDIKNVKDLVVKVYEINTLNYYLDQNQDINTDLNLDGLIANEEFRHQYEETSILRKNRTFDFPSLKGKRGVWIIEFIGNGVSSRALVRKGQLQYLSQPTAAGTMISVFDEANQRVKKSAVWFGGRKYEADEKGRIMLPFSKSGNESIILSDGDFSVFDSIDLADEHYTLTAGFHIERETLLPGAEATVAIRPTLVSSRVKTSVGLLKEVKLTIRSTDLDGIDTSHDVSDFELFDDKEATHTFRVPQRLRTLQFKLTGKIAKVSQGGQKVDLSASQQFEINGIDQTELIADLHLTKVKGKYNIEVLGKSGEALPDRGVNFIFDHDDFAQPIRTSLKSDQNGKINLGVLEGIEHFRAYGSGFEQRDWRPAENFAFVPTSIHSTTGDLVEIPVSNPGSFAIFERRKGTIVANFTSNGKVKESMLEISGLEPGDYEVVLRDTGKKVVLRITESKNTESGYILSKHRHLQIGDSKPLQISKLTGGKKEIKISLTNPSSSTRVHIYATRYLPEFDMHQNLTNGLVDSLIHIGRGGYESRYLSGRDIGEEYRYIIERRSAQKFPGNMASRPGLILNPWALSDTNSSVDDAESGDLYKKSKGSSRSRRSAPKPAAPPRIQSRQIANSPNLDFLPSAAPILLNLKPDENGTITLKREDIGDRQHLHVVAIDSNGIAYRQLSLADEPAIEYRDLRLRTSLTPEKHFTQRRRVSVLDSGDPLTIADIRASEMETYDTLSGIYSVLSSLHNDANLSEFAFILNWPSLDEDKKRELYSKFACHELSFFLSRRDNEFFDRSIKPFLGNKRDKTFMDHYLLGNDLSTYLEPWKFGRLNIVERILLGRQLGGDEKEGMARAVNDWFALLPTHPDKDDKLFRSALRGRRMAGGFKDAPSVAMSLMDDNIVADGFGMVPMSAPSAVRKMRMSRSAIAADPFSPEPAMERSIELDVAEVEELREEAVQQALYRKLELTKEWAENNYYHLPIETQIGELITVNDFWKDYANWNGEGGFYSRHFTSATRNFAEMMLTISVLDLPFKAEEHDIKIENESLTLTANSPVVVFHEEIEERKPAAEKPDILISQNFFRADDRFKKVEGERIDKFVTKEFLTGVLYGCQVVITNPTSSGQKLDLLLQLPEGAVPINRADYTKTYPIQLNPFSTEKLEAAFYFPEVSGEDGFAHYPVHIAKSEQPIAWAEPFRFNVVSELTDVDKASWEYLSQFGDSKQVLDYLEENNVHFLDLTKIAWRMKTDVDFFRETIELLRNRRAYSDELWGYAVLHNDTAVAKEYLTHQDRFLSQSGKQLKCELVTIHPVDRHWYQHLEYSPLVNARTHQLGRQRKILNSKFHGHYHDYMKVLSYTPALNDNDRLGVAYYMFLQDRIEEGLEWFTNIQRENIESAMQYDYLNAYASLYEEEPEVAAKIAGQYKDYGVDKWRERFALIGDQVKEIAGAEVNLTDDPDREQQQDALAAKLPTFEMKTEGAKVDITYQNIEEIKVNYYEMDLEFLFSSQPFVSAGSGQFSFIRPNFSETRKLPADKDAFEFTIPKRFNGRNVLVEAVSSGQKRSAAVYANELKVQMAENYGRIHVRKSSDDSPLSKTYVKVYARFDNGEVKFFKDGYTDLRGKFDYVSLNTDELNHVDRLSVLIMSEKHGAMVKEASPPKM